MLAVAALCWCFSSGCGRGRSAAEPVSGEEIFLLAAGRRHFYMIPGDHLSGDWAYSIRYQRSAACPDGEYVLRLTYKRKPMVKAAAYDQVLTPWGMAMYVGDGRWIDPDRVNLTIDELSRGRVVTPRSAKPVRPASNPTPADIAADCLKALKHKEFKVRSDAVAVLGRLGIAAKETVPALEELLKDKDPSVRQAAAEALKKIKAAQEQKK